MVVLDRTVLVSEHDCRPSRPLKSSQSMVTDCSRKNCARNVPNKDVVNVLWYNDTLQHYMVHCESDAIQLLRIG